MIKISSKPIFQRGFGEDIENKIDFFIKTTKIR